MKIKIKDLPSFEGSVFGAECFLKNWPALKTEGVEVQRLGEFFYIWENGKMAHDSAFFTEEDMSFLEEVS
jgi:hypothetical protein